MLRTKIFANKQNYVCFHQNLLNKYILLTMIVSSVNDFREVAIVDGAHRHIICTNYMKTAVVYIYW